MNQLSHRQQIAQHQVKGIYAITRDLDSVTQIIEEAHLCLQGGIKILQLRNKKLHTEDRILLGKTLRQLCSKYQALLICNDSLELAHTINADGLHIGIDDGTIAEIRQQWHGILGVSCYNDLERAQQAYHAGADYIAFGAVFSSTTKPHAKIAKLDIFTSCKLPIPKVAIGGITLDNMGKVIQSGADAIALISTLFESQDILLQAQQCKAVFALHQPRHLN